MKNSIQARKIVCVYKLMHNSEVVYVGQSVNLYSRLGTHLSSSKVFDECEYEECRVEELDSKETQAIIAHKPKYNKDIPNSDRYVTLTAYKRIKNIDGWEVRRRVKRSGAKPVFMNYYDSRELDKGA